MAAVSSSSRISLEPPPYWASDSMNAVGMMHRYQLLDNNSVPWIRLTVSRSRAPHDTLLPFYIQGDVIEGVVDLDLESETRVNSIDLAVTGCVTFAAADVFEFLDLKQVLWSASMEDPRRSGESSIFGVKPSRLLKGRYSFPFTIRLPSEIELSVKGLQGPRKYPLPPSFSERDSSAHVQYQLLAIVKRVFLGRLKFMSQIGTSFGYIPIKKAGTPSRLRQHAYSSQTPLVGPDRDPGGWKTFDPIVVRGRVFNQRDIEIVFTLSLASPLSYTRGTVIPCALTATSKDEQALSFLTHPNSIGLHLLRRHSQTAERRPELEEDVTFVTSAAWWPATKSYHSAASSSRTLHGEIHLEKKLKPSFVLAYFKFSYHVVMFPPTAATFCYSRGNDQPLLSQEVELVAAHADGPRPRIYTPPGYEIPPAPPQFGFGTYLWRAMGNTLRSYHGSPLEY